MHRVDELAILHVLSAVLRQQLLAEDRNKLSEVGALCEFHVLLGEHDADLDLVRDTRHHRESKRLSFPHGRVRAARRWSLHVVNVLSVY